MNFNIFMIFQSQQIACNDYREPSHDLWWPWPMLCQHQPNRPPAGWKLPAHIMQAVVSLDDTVHGHAKPPWAN